MIRTVDTAKLITPELMTCYIEKRHWPYFQGMRFTMELLGIDPPAPLQRRARGCRRTAEPSRMTLWRDKQKAKQASQ